MKKAIISLVLILGFSILNYNCQAQKIDNPTISDFKWLTGSWIGDGFGGVSHESWTEPAANSMVGVYKHFVGEKPSFYEFMVISVWSDSISLKLKHFNPDMSGWEEKADFEEFKLISVTPTKIEFDGLVYELIEKDKMEITLTLEQEGEISIEVFHFERSID